MKHLQLTLTFLLALQPAFLRAADQPLAAIRTRPDSSVLLWLPLDDGFGTVATDRSLNQLEAELSNVQWAKGTFGTAAWFCGSNAFIEIPPLPALNGATQFTISVWATWEGTGRYPNLLTTHNWSPGGLMFFVSDNSCSFRMGRPGHRAGAPDNAWTETGVPLLNALPMRRWVHLCVVFDLPNLTTYVNGKPVGKQTWAYPVEAQGLRLGGWSGPVSHQGLMDELRIYNRPLTPEEVASLAQDPARASAAYTVIDESLNPPPLAATLDNRRALLTIDKLGRVTSLRNKTSGRELLARPQELVSARLKDGRRLIARKASFENGVLLFEFSRGQGSAVISVNIRPDYFTFTLRSLSVPGVSECTFLNLPVAPGKYRGGMANMLSDDTDAVCLRGYELPVEMALDSAPPGLHVSTTAEHGLTGWRAGLAAGSKSQMPAMLRAMMAETGLPVSKAGGPWALDSEVNRGSYLFADFSLASVDDWVALARRGGFTHIHIHGWWDTLGHYNVNTNLFPAGLPDLKAAVDRIHAAGLKAGVHTLTACIDPRDAWVTPEASPHLIATHQYTLAQPLAPDNTVIYVNEKPAADHDVVFTYMGNGNTIRIGTEIVQYSEVVGERPYAFAKCRRGAFKTRPAAHAAGTRADYLQQRYIAFYPQPGSPLAESLVDCIANVFNTCQLDQIYFDGSEGMMSRYGIDFMRHAIFKRLRGEVLVEASEWGKHSWWFHSRLGAWDHPVWAPKRFHDLHIASAAKFRDSDLLGSQMGWWAPREPSAQARGHFLDEMEYFGTKNLGIDSAMSIQGVNVSHQPLGFHLEKQFTLLGWYEQLRLARYFDASTIARVAVPGEEFRLRQDREGVWKFTPVTMSAHRITGLGNGSESWTNHNRFRDQPVSARIEALFSVAPYSDSKGILVSDFADVSAFKQTSASTVSLIVDQATGETRGGDRNLSLRALNKGVLRRGAWAKATLSFPAPYKNLSGTAAFGLWVKSDGKGALLNLQLATPREYMHALSDHYITLDFTGWRYVELLVRERDVERLSDYQWPYSGSYDFYRNPLDMVHISELNFYLNELPPEDATEVVISPVMALPIMPAELKNPTLLVNSQRMALPVMLRSGDFLEIDPQGGCAHYGPKGDLLASVHPLLADTWPVLRFGSNAVAFDCDRPTNASARAEVTLSALGTPFGTPSPRSRIGWKFLPREYDMPRWILLPGNTNNIWDLSVRPGERARLELELSGTMERPVLTVNGQELSFPVSLKAGDRLICQDQGRWTVLNAQRAKITEGALPAAPLLNSGPNRISFTCGSPERAVVKLAKIYR